MADISEELKKVENIIRMYNNVVETAFTRCVYGFRSSEMAPEEKKCFAETTTKMLRHAARCRQRFAEIQQIKQSEIQEKMKKAAKVGDDVAGPSF